MEFDDDLSGFLAGFSVGELMACKDVCKTVSYYYFDEYRRTKSRAVKTKLDIICGFVTEVESVLKKAQKEMDNE